MQSLVSEAWQERTRQGAVSGAGGWLSPGVEFLPQPSGCWCSKSVHMGALITWGEKTVVEEPPGRKHRRCYNHVWGFAQSLPLFNAEAHCYEAWVFAAAAQCCAGGGGCMYRSTVKRLGLSAPRSIVR